MQQAINIIQQVLDGAIKNGLIQSLADTQTIAAAWNEILLKVKGGEPEKNYTEDGGHTNNG